MEHATKQSVEQRDFAQPKETFLNRFRLYIGGGIFLIFLGLVLCVLVLIESFLLAQKQERQEKMTFLFMYLVSGALIVFGLTGVLLFEVIWVGSFLALTTSIFIFSWYRTQILDKGLRWDWRSFFHRVGLLTVLSIIGGLFFVTPFFWIPITVFIIFLEVIGYRLSSDLEEFNEAVATREEALDFY